MPLQVFDVASFDMIAMLRLSFVPGVVDWIFRVREGYLELSASSIMVLAVVKDTCSILYCLQANFLQY